MFSIRPDKDTLVEKRKITVNSRKVPILILRTKDTKPNATGVLWIHGGESAGGGLTAAVCMKARDEPFYAETLAFIENLKKAGVEAEVDVYPGLYHAFDMMEPELEVSKEAIAKFEERFEYACEHYFVMEEGQCLK